MFQGPENPSGPAAPGALDFPNQSAAGICRDRTGATGPVGDSFPTAINQGSQAGLHVLQPGPCQSAVAIIQPTPISCRRRTACPGGCQGTLRITPPEQRLKTLQVMRPPQRAA